MHQSLDALNGELILPPPNQYDINTIYILANEELTGLDENWNIKYFDQYAVAYSSKIKGK